MPIRHNMLGSIPTDTERTFFTLADGQLGTLSCSVHEKVLNPEAVVPWHYHRVEEVVCMSGEGECTFRHCAPAKYRAGRVLIIPPNTPHTLRNVGPDRLSQLPIFGGVVPGTEWIDPEVSIAKARALGSRRRGVTSSDPKLSHSQLSQLYRVGFCRGRCGDDQSAAGLRASAS